MLAGVVAGGSEASGFRGRSTGNVTAMNEATQFCIGLDDQPGLLAELCGALRTGGVNIEAIFVADDPDCCWVNVVLDTVAAARKVLTEHGYNFFTEPVLTIELDDRPGEMERVAGTLSAADVNINYVYGSSTKGERFFLVLNVSDVPRAKKALSAASSSTGKLTGA